MCRRAVTDKLNVQFENQKKILTFVFTVQKQSIFGPGADFDIKYVRWQFLKKVVR